MTPPGQDNIRLFVRRSALGMDLKFTIAEPETMAFSEQYYKDSASYRRIRNRTRWALAAVLLPILAVFTYLFGFSWTIAAIFGAAAVAWIVIAPKRFDTRVRNCMQRQMFESSYSKVFGVY
jgi:glutathione S-transferase